MATKLERERSKQIQDKCQRLLNEMLKDDDNKYCVDCDAKGPRWASWNLGIFLCIRCAGIHRKLGVHISRVKSVNLDSWTPQQVVCLEQMGNSRARAVYEANLPDNFRRPQNEGNLETFIRAKYEQKKYVAHEWVAPPLPKVNWDKELEEETQKLKKKKRESQQANISSIRPLSTPPVIPQPLPKPQPYSSKPGRISTHTTDLLELDTPTKEMPGKKPASDSDLFTSFLDSSTDTSSNTSTVEVSGSPALGTAARTEEEENFFNQSIAPIPNKQQQLTKDSILALYGNPCTYVPSQLGTAPVSNIFNSVPTNGISNSFPAQQTQFQNQNVSLSSTVPTSNVSFASNPFYSMAASGAQADFAQQTFFANFPSTNGTVGADVQQSQLTQRMDTLNLKNSGLNQFVLQQSNHFDSNAGSKQQPNFGQTIWQ